MHLGGTSWSGGVIINTCTKLQLLLGDGSCDEIRLSVEFVAVGFLRICRHSCCD